MVKKISKKDCKKQTIKKKVCNQWGKNKLENPRSCRSIKKNKGTYNKLKKECSKSLSQNKLCNKWIKNKFVDPINSKNIKKNSRRYKQLEKQCLKYWEKYLFDILHLNYSSIKKSITYIKNEIGKEYLINFLHIFSPYLFQIS